MVATESFMIQKLSSCLVKLLHAGSAQNTPGDLFAAECFEQLLSTNSLDFVFNVILSLLLWFFLFCLTDFCFLNPCEV